MVVIFDPIHRYSIENSPLFLFTLQAPILSTQLSSGHPQLHQKIRPSIFIIITITSIDFIPFLLGHIL